MSNCWSRDDKLFVDAKLEVLWFDITFASSAVESLPMEQRSGVVYDGPKGDDFKGFLSKMGYRVNSKGRVIVAVREDEKVEAFHYFLLDKVVPLGPFGFPNPPLPTWKEVMKLRSLLDETKAELEKKNDELNRSQQQLDSIRTELQSLVDETKALLAKKNDELNESRRQLEDIKKAPMKKTVVNPQYGKISPPQDPGDSSNISEFLRRMNGTYINSKGMYIKFDFTAAKSSGPWVTSDNSLHYYTRNRRVTDPFSLVQFDWNRCPMDIQERQVVLPKVKENGHQVEICSWFYKLKVGAYFGAALTFKEFCFIGRITVVSGTDSFENSLVNVFFEQNMYDKNYCYKDALATTFFILKSKDVYRNEVCEIEFPRFL